MDDFGTEQSCLSLLHKLPIDTIKLDRSFIRAMDGEPGVLPIIQAIVSMAHSLGKRALSPKQSNTLVRCPIWSGWETWTFRDFCSAGPSRPRKFRPISCDGATGSRCRKPFSVPPRGGVGRNEHRAAVRFLRRGLLEAQVRSERAIALAGNRPFVRIFQRSGLASRLQLCDTGFLSFPPAVVGVSLALPPPLPL